MSTMEPEPGNEGSKELSDPFGPWMKLGLMESRSSSRFLGIHPRHAPRGDWRVQLLVIRIYNCILRAKVCNIGKTLCISDDTEDA